MPFKVSAAPLLDIIPVSAGSSLAWVSLLPGCAQLAAAEGFPLSVELTADGSVRVRQQLRSARAYTNTHTHIELALLEMKLTAGCE